MDSRGSNGAPGAFVCPECAEVYPLNETAELHEEGPHRVLEGVDRTVGIGEGGLEMCKDLCRRSARRFGRQLGWRPPRQQCRADFALAQVEPFPNALPGPVTSPAVGSGADRSGDAAGDGGFEKSPQSAGSQAQPSDFVRAPDAEGPSAAVPCMAVAAKDPPSANGFSLGVALVVSAQIAVPNQGANNFAVRTRRLLELFSNRAPFVLTAAKPSLLAHVRPMPPRKAQFYERGNVRGRGGVR